MKITLRKVKNSPYNFEKTVDGITIKGFLQYDNDKLIKLNARLTGSIELVCDSCAEEFELDIDEELNYFISDGIYQDENNSLIDVVEAENGEFDIDELIHSEIELIKNDYNYCDFCEMSED